MGSCWRWFGGGGLIGPLKIFLLDVRSRARAGRAPAADDVAQAPIMPLAFYL